MSDDSPIDGSDTFRSGVNVVDIGDLRIKRGYTRRPPMYCQHHRVIYDDRERRLWCEDCEKGIDAFDYLRAFIEQYNRVLGKMKRREEALVEAEAFQVRNRAAKVMDEAWRKRSTVPLCPHCQHGIFPEDVVNGVASMSRPMAKGINRNSKNKGGSNE